MSAVSEFQTTVLEMAKCLAPRTVVVLWMTSIRVSADLRCRLLAHTRPAHSRSDPFMHLNTFIAHLNLETNLSSFGHDFVGHVLGVPCEGLLYHSYLPYVGLIDKFLNWHSFICLLLDLLGMMYCATQPT